MTTQKNVSKKIIAIFFDQEYNEWVRVAKMQLAWESLYEWSRSKLVT